MSDPNPKPRSDFWWQLASMVSGPTQRWFGMDIAGGVKMVGSDSKTTQPIRPTDNYLLAADRLRHYVAMRDEQPIRQSADIIHAIHTGTQWEAELLLSDLRILLKGSP